MPTAEPLVLGYVLKRYPRFSETFVVNEILAHERAGVPVHIFALGPVEESHFQAILAQVRAQVHYIPHNVLKAETLWSAFAQASDVLPGFWSAIGELKGEPVRDLYQSVLLAVKARELGVTHLHAHFATISTTIGRLAGELAGLTYSFTAHAKDIYQAEVDREAFRLKLADAAAAITISDYNLKWLREQYGTAAERLYRIFNGLELASFPFASPAQRPPHILAVGRLVEKKGFDTLVEACALLRERSLPFTCTIIGDGPVRDQLGAAIERHSLGDKVMLAGPRAQSELEHEHRLSAVFAAPCVIAADGDRDGLPTVLLESMALGTPCVSTDVTGIPEVVRNEETGLLVPQRDPAALADALARLLSDGDLRVRLATAARQLVERDFDIDRNAADIRLVITTALARRAQALRVVA